jgi:hypothetical protein
MTKEQRAAAMVRAADDAIARLHGDVDPTMMFSLVITAVKEAVPDVEQEEVKEALAVKRPISRRQRIRAWVASSLAADDDKVVGWTFTGRNPVFVTNDEVVDRLFRDKSTSELERLSKDERYEVFADIIEELAREKISGAFTSAGSFLSPAFDRATSVPDLISRMTDLDRFIAFLILCSALHITLGRNGHCSADLDKKFKEMAERQPGRIKRVPSTSETAQVTNCFARLGAMAGNNEDGYHLTFKQPLSDLFDTLLKDDLTEIVDLLRRARNE